MIIRYTIILSGALWLSGCALEAQKPTSLPHDRPPSYIEASVKKHHPFSLSELLEDTEFDKQQAQEDEIESQADILWPRLRSGLQLKAYYNHPKVAEIRANYLAKPGYFEQLVENAEPYLQHIVSAVEQYDLPLELALLPAIESNFNPTAQSPRQASGLWQFIPSTGKHFGLRQTRGYDGRRDVVASTNAALRYLKKLHEIVDDDWLKAIAAYNCGEGRLLQAMESNRAQGKSEDLWSLNLPLETTEYVPRLLAVASIIANPKRYDVRLPALFDQKTFESVAVTEPIDLPRVAETLNISYSQLRKLNPAFTRTTTAPGIHHLLVPPGKASSLRKAFAQLRVKWEEQVPRSKSSKTTQRTQDTSGKSYKIRSGDSLSTIAQRFDVTVKSLLQANRMTKKSRLKIGSTLRIPRAGIQTARADNASRSLARAPNKPTNKPKAKPVKQDKRHVVQAGDTLWTLARRYNTDVAKLRAVNALPKHAVLHLGHQIVIPD